MVTETGSRPRDWRCIFQLGDGFDCKLNDDDVTELASHIRAVIEREQHYHKPVRNDQGEEITVRRFESLVTIDFWSPILPTSGNRLTLAQARSLLHELVAFSEAVERTAQR